MTGRRFGLLSDMLLVTQQGFVHCHQLLLCADISLLDVVESAWANDTNTALVETKRSSASCSDASDHKHNNRSISEHPERPIHDEIRLPSSTKSTSRLTDYWKKESHCHDSQAAIQSQQAQIAVWEDRRMSAQTLPTFMLRHPEVIIGVTRCSTPATRVSIRYQ